MREHYRKKREIAASSLGSGINQTSSQRSQRLKHVPFARYPNNAIKQYRKLAPYPATRRLLPSITASSTHEPTPKKPRSDSPPFHEPQKSPSLAGNRVADVLLPSSDRHIRRQLHEALWHYATITRPVLVDPVSDMTASLAVESRRHFRHCLSCTDTRLFLMLFSTEADMNRLSDAKCMAEPTFGLFNL